MIDIVFLEKSYRFLNGSHQAAVCHMYFKVLPHWLQPQAVVVVACIPPLFFTFGVSFWDVPLSL